MITFEPRFGAQSGAGVFRSASNIAENDHDDEGIPGNADHEAVHSARTMFRSPVAQRAFAVAQRSGSPLVNRHRSERARAFPSAVRGVSPPARRCLRWTINKRIEGLGS